MFTATAMANAKAEVFRATQEISVCPAIKTGNISGFNGPLAIH
jgi:hypothetical protein